MVQGPYFVRPPPFPNAKKRLAATMIEQVFPFFPKMTGLWKKRFLYKYK
jgi:hypothetical protein